MEELKKTSQPTKSRKDLIFKIICGIVILTLLGVLIYKHYTKPEQQVTYCELNETMYSPGGHVDACALIKIVSTDINNISSGPTNMENEICAVKLSELPECSSGEMYYGKFKTPLGYYCLGYFANFVNISDMDKMYVESFFIEKNVESVERLKSLVEDCKGEAYEGGI